MINEYKEGRKAGKSFAKSIEQTGAFMSDGDAEKFVVSKSKEYQEGFISGWNDYWKNPLMKNC
jgi:hypothetical protein